MKSRHAIAAAVIAPAALAAAFMSGIVPDGPRPFTGEQEIAVATAAPLEVIIPTLSTNPPAPSAVPDQDVPAAQEPSVEVITETVTELIDENGNVVSRDSEQVVAPVPAQPVAAVPETVYGQVSARADDPCDSPMTTRPNRLYIPALCVDAPLTTETISDGFMTIPRDPSKVGWLDSTAAMSAGHGTSLVAGHVTYNKDKGALFSLKEVYAGAEIVTTDASNNRYRWAVSSLDMYDKDYLPTDVFDPGTNRRLAVITCGGTIVNMDRGRHYDSNVVAIALPVR